MKAKLISENINFERNVAHDNDVITESQNFERNIDPKKSMNIGRVRNNQNIAGKIISYETSKISYETRKLWWAVISVARKIHFDNYTMEEVIFDTADSNGWFESGLKTRERKYIELIGACVEIGFILNDGMLDLLKNSDYYINESQYFERNIDPKKSLQVGQEHQRLQMIKKAESIDWDWYPDPDDGYDEEIIDLIPYPMPEDPNLHLKISILDGEHYIGVNNIGEPYNDEPDAYDSPEEAIKGEKSYLDEYFEDRREEDREYQESLK